MAGGYLNEGGNPWQVDYQGNLMRSIEANNLTKEFQEVLADREKAIEIWKKHAASVQRDFDDVVKQRNQRECQAFAWRDVVRELIQAHPELDKEKINEMFDKTREAYYERVRSNGKPV
jgi:hypothetical protein